MSLLQTLTVCLVAAIHLYLMFVEMFAWESRGARFLTRFDQEFFAISKPLAANMGLYNGFFAVGLLLSQFFLAPPFQAKALMFLLSCLAIAGIVGARTAEKKLFLVQSVPAFVGIGLVLLVLLA
ncbi:MAG: DUF1304 domain-containing protein [Pseudomonadota bacterium]